MKRVLVARLDSMGDVLVAGPAVRAIAETGRVLMLCGPEGAPAASMLPGVDSVLVWESPWIMTQAPPASPAHIDRLMQMIRRARIDEAIILTSFHQSPLPLALVLRMAGVPRITGASVDFPGSLLDVRLRPGEDFPEELPEPERALRIAAAAGCPAPDDGRLAVLPPPDTAHLTGPPGYTVLHPGASAPARTWPINRFAETARLLTEAGRRVIITGSAGEQSLAELIRSEAPDAVSVAGACTLPELAGVLAAAEAVVVGNTGPAHLAAAVGTPIVSLFSPVVPASKWAPYGVRTVLLGNQFERCRDSRARVCPVPGHPCLSRVRGEDVLEALDFLRANQPATAEVTR